MTATISETRSAIYSVEVTIEAPRARVWQALVDETNLWWLPDFHVVGEGSVVTLDAEAGGHLIERRDDGRSMLWFTVTNVIPGEQLDLCGPLTPQYGGPATTMVSIRLAEEAGVTQLTLTDALFGHVPEPLLRSLEGGWKLLFGEGLKKFVEGAQA